MSRNWVLALAIAALIAVGSGPVHALGDVCYREVSARGAVTSNYRGAIDSAIGAWQSRVKRTAGRRAANWYYSVDRVVECGWNDPGTRIQCSARALPCEPKRRYR